MAGESARVNYNLRERITSSDQNKQIQLDQRMTQEALFAATALDEPASGVIRGLRVSIDSGLRTATVDVGLGLLIDSGVTYPDSQYRWMEVSTPIVASIPGGTGYPRWDVVEIEPNSAATITTNVDVWDPAVPPSGAFVPQNLQKEFQSVPIVTVRAGADNTPDPPNFPAGTAGRIPLAYIYVDAAGVVSNVRTGIVQCRPLLMPEGSLLDRFALSFDLGRADVIGGGIDVISAGSSNISPILCRGRFRGQRMEFNIVNVVFDITQTGSWFSFPVNDEIGYVYAFNAPYPTGYGTLAGREFFVGSNVRQHFDCIDNAADGQSNCGLIVSHSSPPLTSGIGFQAQGGSLGGVITVNDWPFRTGTTKAQVSLQDTIYLGAFDFDFSANAAMKQTYAGSGRVFMEERTCSQRIDNQVAINTWLDYDVRVPGPSAAAGTTDGLVPFSAHILGCKLSYISRS